MILRLISHVNGDSDLIEAWLRYYRGLGVQSFHLVVHGPEPENKALYEIQSSYPVHIEDRYEGPFDGEQKKRRLDAVLSRFPNQWILVVDSDEFVEFPYGDIPGTIRKLEFAHANVMFAPMLQRLKSDGTLDSPGVIQDPFEMFPLCSVDLYERMGSTACIFKYPLFYCTEKTQLEEEGNHNPPLGAERRTSALRGVTHHFKFRRTVADRLYRRINSAYSFRHESVQFQEYLECHGNCLPLEGTFLYSRKELFRRGLLKRLSWRNRIRSVARMTGIYN